MEEYGVLPSNLLKYCNIPLKNLQISGRVWLSHHLNPERPSFSSRNQLLQDWRGMAEHFNFDQLYVENFQRLPDPMGEVIKNLPIMNSEATLGSLLMGLWNMERFDILEDSDLVKILEKSQLVKKAVLVGKVKNCRSPLTFDALYMNGQEVYPEEFDAFVCYTRQDIGFVQEIINELENKKHFKLCIPDRDVLPGPAKYDAYTKLIKERCGPMIIVLSPDYNRSEECKFLTFFAHSLGPDAKHQKLIPVVYKHCDIPNVLSHISLVDYTRSDVIEWFWSRLS
ncbi:hypothetical protein HELRODRAFT_70561, partial [Helobdella robusta]|uniref:TIR domain-containing protein n=1 Tax=Helobdella robusta TaxID=6412 RepID=T1G086_HELRO